MAQRMAPIYPGQQVCTLLGETDSAADGSERKTAPGTWGHVTQLNHDDHWDVTFPDGAWVVLTTAELLDRSQYKLDEPDTLEQRALALQYAQDVLELTVLDDECFGMTTDVAANPEHILSLYAEVRRLRDDAADLLDIVRKAWNRWDRDDQESNPALGNALERLAGATFPWESTVS